MDKYIRSFLTQEAIQEKAISPNGIYRHMNHYHWANQVIDRKVEGDFVELGVYLGGTAKLLALVMNWKKSNKTLHLYDSFEGLPELTDEDEPSDEIKSRMETLFKKGLFEVSQQRLSQTMRRLHNYIVYPGWFSETIPNKLPDKICYAHLDGDLYSSMLESLEGVYPRLSPGAICVIDDYDNEGLPGVNQAVSEFMVDKPERVESMFIGWDQSSIQGFFVKS